jgi:hypothetical protein
MAVCFFPELKTEIAEPRRHRIYFFFGKFVLALQANPSGEPIRSAHKLHKIKWLFYLDRLNPWAWTCRDITIAGVTVIVSPP